MVEVDVSEVVCGATRKDLIVVITDENNNPVNITGCTVRLQGKSADIAKVLNVVGTVLDGVNGKAKWTGIGDETTYISQTTDLASGTIPQATYTFRAQFTDGTAKVDYSAEFQIRWVKKPI